MIGEEEINITQVYDCIFISWRCYSTTSIWLNCKDWKCC